MCYYFEDIDVLVKISSSEMDYNHEYLGNSPRLVIAPLTDGCYIIYLEPSISTTVVLMRVLPALERFVEGVGPPVYLSSHYVFVLNCSDSLDYTQMGKMFKGLASCGAWS